MKTHNISASVESLVLTVVLAFIVGPIGKLDGSICTCSNCVWDGSNLVALVARNDFCNIADDLLGEFALLIGFWDLLVSDRNT